MTQEPTHDGTRWSNAEEDRIEIVPYDSQWPVLYRRERRRLRTVLPANPGYTLEHFGSTAIPGMASKPVIDILLVCAERERWDRFVEPLESLDYVYWADNPGNDRMFFVKGMPPYGKARTHHVHVRMPENARQVLAFRDHLRERPDEAKQYEKLKRKLMNRHETDREAYTLGKKEFIEKIMGRLE